MLDSVDVAEVMLGVPSAQFDSVRGSVTPRVASPRVSAAPIRSTGASGSCRCRRDSRLCFS